MDGFKELKAHPEYNGKLPKTDPADPQNKVPKWMVGKFTDSTGTNNTLGGWRPESVDQFSKHTLALIQDRKDNMPKILQMERDMLKAIQKKEGVKLTHTGEKAKKKRKRNSNEKADAAKKQLAAVNLDFGEE